MENKDVFKDAVDEIRSLNCLISIMQNYNMNLKKDNSGYYTNCVFHNDKTPSLRLSDKGNRDLSLFWMWGTRRYYKLYL